MSDQIKNTADTSAAMTPPNGIKGITVAESWWTPEHAVLLVLPILMSLVLAWATLWILGRRGQKRISQTPMVEDPWLALGAWLRRCDLPGSFDEGSTSDWLTYASKISLAAREIVMRNTNLPCVDWTTDEFAVQVGRLNETAKRTLEHSDVLSLLRETDLVRFAGRSPAEGAAARWLEAVKSWYQMLDDSAPPSTAPSPKSGGLRVFG